MAIDTNRVVNVPPPTTEMQTDKVETLIEELESFQDENNLCAPQENVRQFWQRRLNVVDDVLNSIGYEISYGDAVIKLRKVGIMVDEVGSIRDGMFTAYDLYLRKIEVFPLFDLVIAEYNTTFGDKIILRNSNGDKLFRYDVDTGSGKLLDGVTDSCVESILKTQSEFQKDCITFCESSTAGSKFDLIKEAGNHLIQHYPSALVKVSTFFIVEDFLKSQRKQQPTPQQSRK